MLRLDRLTDGTAGTRVTDSSVCSWSTCASFDSYYELSILYSDCLRRDQTRGSKVVKFDPPISPDQLIPRLRRSPRCNPSLETFWEYEYM